MRQRIVATAIAGLGLIGASIAAVLKDEVKDWTHYIVSWGKDYSCEFRSPQKPTENQLAVLFPRLEDDPKDENWRSIMKILYDETDFDVVPSCLRFSTTTSASKDTARAQFLATMDPQIRVIRADMLLFGTVFAPGRVKVWSANSLGDCEWQSKPVDLNDLNAAKGEVFKITRSALLRAIVEGLTAACNREPTDDWRGLARIVDIVGSYLEKKKTELVATDYDNAQLHLFALSYSHYTKVGEAPWLERASRAINALISHASSTNNSSAVATYRDQLSFLSWREFQKTNSPSALKEFIAYIRAARSGGSQSWDSLLSLDGDAVVAALEASLSLGLYGVTAEEIEQTRMTYAHLEIFKNNEAIRLDPKNAAAYKSRGQAYEIRKEFDHAIADYNEAIMLDPTNADYFNQRCWVRAITDLDLLQALNDCNESLRLRPNNGDTLNSRALVQFKRGAFDRAIADYDAAFKLNPKDAGSLYGRGMARVKSGDSSVGNADIAHSKTIQADVDIVYADYGIK